MASPLKIYENSKPYHVNPCVAINGTETQLKQLEFDYSRIAIISVHGDPSVDFGKEEAGGQNVYCFNIGMELARLGWKVCEKCV